MSKTVKKTTSVGKPGQRLTAFRKSRVYDILYNKGILYFVISFMIPAVIMALAFENIDIAPFGKEDTEQMLVVDLWHQYFPFFRVVREKLLTGGSFLYSWMNGMGTNFLSLISYYAASPLNWLSVFFGEESVREALTIILVAKIGFCGAFFSCFLRYTFKRKDFSICIFSTMFALCSYMMGYYWNVMWFDTVALFPLVMLGVVAICREGKWKTFTFALALSLISNYYVGYFTCIFTIFMFAAAIILNAKGIKDAVYKLWIIARSAVLGIALGGFMLLPAYCGLQLTHSANNKFPEEITFYESWTDIFANLISYNEPATKEGLPNFACGMLAIVLLGVFLFADKIKIREKISAVLMLALIAVSCNMNVLNYIWHGFHFTNMIPYRFAFIFSFVLIAAAYRAYDVILTNGLKIYQIIGMLAFPWLVFYLNYATSEAEKFTMSKPFKNSLIITAAFILIFIAMKVFPFTNVKVRNTVLSLCIGAAVISECYSNALIGVETVGGSAYGSYPTYGDEIQSLLVAAEKKETNENNLFYRTEVNKTYTLNDSALYGYEGISQFSSSANVSVTKFIKRLGLYGSEAGNRYYYRISTPVVNSMLGVKYIINKGATLKSEEMALKLSGSAASCHIYENQYPLSLGYMVDEKILELKEESYGNPFEYQNELLSLASGVDEKCFLPQPVALAKYEGVTVTKRAYGDYTYTKEKGADTDGSVTYTFDGVKDGYLYGYATNGGCETVKVTDDAGAVDSNIAIDDYPIVFPMGNSQEGEQVEAQIICKKANKSGSYKLMVYALSQSVFEKAYEALADEQLYITEFYDTNIKGTVNAKKDGILFLSMPYEKGWTISIDGKEAETFAVAQSMTGVRVSAGKHDIELKYVPEGFAAGTAATGVSIVLCGVIAYFDYRKKKKNGVPEEAHEVKIIKSTTMETVETPVLAEDSTELKAEDKVEEKKAHEASTEEKKADGKKKNSSGKKRNGKKK